VNVKPEQRSVKRFRIE